MFESMPNTFLQFWTDEELRVHLKEQMYYPYAANWKKQIVDEIKRRGEK